jgi:hypothetical protein
VGPPEFGPGDAFVTDIFTFGGFEWAVPALALSVPGLLVILALMAQGVIGLVWLPYVRRSLRGLGVRDRRRQARRTPA